VIIFGMLVPLRCDGRSWLAGEYEQNETLCLQQIYYFIV